MPQMLPVQGSAVSRRTLLVGAGAALSMPHGPAAAAARAEPTLSEALRKRRSVRTYDDRRIDPMLLADLLWSAFGINRPKDGLHTAPSWGGAADLIVHAATEEGIVVYEPEANEVRIWKAGDVRARLSPQPFVAKAPVCLILVCDLRRLAAAGQQEQRQLFAMVDAAMAAENVYLFAAARGLGTCLVGDIHRAAITETLGLARHEFPAFVQPVGWPA